MSGCSSEGCERLCFLGREAVWPTGDTCMVLTRVAGSMKIELPVSGQRSRVAYRRHVHGTYKSSWQHEN